jgi:hypothetical protein
MEASASTGEDNVGRQSDRHHPAQIAFSLRWSLGEHGLEPLTVAMLVLPPAAFFTG